MQVSAEDLTPGEDRTLRSRLRQLEARRSSVERAGLVHSALSGDGGVGGLDDMLRTVRGHLQAIAEQEQAYSAMAGQLSSPCRDLVSGVTAIPRVAERRVVRLGGWEADWTSMQPDRGQCSHLEGLALSLHSSAAWHWLRRAALLL